MESVSNLKHPPEPRKNHKASPAMCEIHQKPARKWKNNRNVPTEYQMRMSICTCGTQSRDVRRIFYPTTSGAIRGDACTNFIYVDGRLLFIYSLWRWKSFNMDARAAPIIYSRVPLLRNLNPDTHVFNQTQKPIFFPSFSPTRMCFINRRQEIKSVNGRDEWRRTGIGSFVLELDK